MIHELKCWPSPFEAVMRGKKTFEYRKNDRNFEVGDDLILKEWVPGKSEYTGLELQVEVTYIIREGYGIPEGYCIMSIRF